MDDDFRIRLAFKAVTVPDQLLPEGHIVFDDTVMDHGKPSVIAQMRMGIFFRGSPVGRPAGMADTCRPGHAGPVLCLLTQVRDPARHLADGDLMLIHDRDASRIITPVFQLFQAVKQDRRGTLRTGKPNNSTHKDCLP